MPHLQFLQFVQFREYTETAIPSPMDKLNLRFISFAGVFAAAAAPGALAQGRQVILGATIEGADALEVFARPWKHPETGQWLNPRKFQIVSAGPDLSFNTDDDIVYPTVPR